VDAAILIVFKRFQVGFFKFALETCRDGNKRLGRSKSGRVGLPHPRDETIDNS
jgi:hypothetical protein